MAERQRRGVTEGECDESERTEQPSDTDCSSSRPASERSQRTDRVVEWRVDSAAGRHRAGDSNRSKTLR